MTKEKNKFQELLFSSIKILLGKNQNLVDVLSTVLNISYDSAYRRLRGETLLDINEIIILSNKFSISLDNLYSLNHQVNFKFHPMNSGIESLSTYIDSIYQEMKYGSKFPDAHFIFTAEDLPVFHYFNFELLSSFKLFYWSKSILNSPEFNGKKFNISSIDNELILKTKQIHELYKIIPSTEIWDEDTLNTILKQLSFYWEAGLFEKKEYPIELCLELENLLDTAQNYAVIQSKNGPSLSPNYTLYSSEVTIGNNCIYLSANSIQTVYFSFNTFNTINTRNTDFCNETSLWIKNLIAKSTQISGVSEKLRHQFFLKLKNKVINLRNQIENNKS